MKPMFSYYGSKYKLAKHYGEPRYDTVIEPFAGSAAYSLYWEPKKVILVDISPQISLIWDYLIRVSESEILNLPTNFLKIDELNIDYRAKLLMGFWVGKGKSSAGLSKSKWGIQYANSPDCKVWGEPVKRRIASQLYKIRNWEIISGDYTKAPDIEAHWLIDPPYNSAAGKRYPYKNINYDELGLWIKSKKGFVQVCENEGASWLDFKPFKSINTYHHMKEKGKRKAKFSNEVLYQQGAI